MLEGHTERHLIERRMIESSNSEVIKIHSDPLRSDHGSNQRRSEAIAYGLLDEPFGLAARQRRAGTTCGETGTPSARARRATAQDGAVTKDSATAQDSTAALTESVRGLRGGGARGCSLGGDLFTSLKLKARGMARSRGKQPG